eukprot:scaffold169936_cov26-Tisochrysis_lutea.AAC.4
MSVSQPPLSAKDTHVSEAGQQAKRIATKAVVGYGVQCSGEGWASGPPAACQHYSLQMRRMRHGTAAA